LLDMLCSSLVSNVRYPSHSVMLKTLKRLV